MLKQRILSILILAPVFIVAVLLLPNAWFKVLLSAVLALAAFEWAGLAGVSGFGGSLLYALLLVVLAYLGDRYADTLHLHGWIYWLSACWWLSVLIWVVLSQYQSRIRNFGNGIKMAMGLITLLPVWYALSKLHATEHTGPQLALYLILVVWFADIGAYVFGRLLGRTKLAPVVSPGKTIEGVAGGLVIVMLLAPGAAVYFGLQGNRLWIFSLVSILVAAVSVVGDLYESILKRQAGVKDSGNVLPGHGGALDRIDSLTAAAPVFILSFGFFLS